jgi:alkanesulfonate monooxygenase SsuD/methylene tetrahydromethanopterin reductase-like flavin-dependent oxidoreductase (luciferase family)
MHVGMSTFFQNLDGQTDAEVYAHEVGMADSAEPLGFDSIWSAEHHFTPYTMCPNVAQFLTYMAGRTRHVRLGSMVMVIPWHHPVRLAEEICVLDQLSGGRAILGIGRGLGPVEFKGFGVDMNESRERFVEYAETLLTGLETGVMERAGPLYHQSRIEIRPGPLATWRGRVYASAVSPESARIMARLGIGIMIIAQKPWDKTIAEIEAYRGIYRELNGGAEPPKPLLVTFIACHEDAAVAEEMRYKYIRGYSRSALNHYEFANKGLGEIRGYEYYAGLARNIEKHGIEAFVDFLSNLQVWGTPDQVFARMMDYRDRIDAAGFVTIFSYGGMPPAMARANMELFARTVLPRLKAIDTGAQVGAALARAAE